MEFKNEKKKTDKKSERLPLSTFFRIRWCFGFYFVSVVFHVEVFRMRNLFCCKYPWKLIDGFSQRTEVNVILIRWRWIYSQVNAWFNWKMHLVHTYWIPFGHRDWCDILIDWVLALWGMICFCIFSRNNVQFGLQHVLHLTKICISIIDLNDLQVIRVLQRHCIHIFVKHVASPGWKSDVPKYQNKQAQCIRINN